MKPYIHSQLHAKKFGGKPEDYQKINDWFDQSKAHVPDLRHRTVLHNSLGIFICEQVFGTNIKNSDGKLVSVRDIGEQHVLDDLGFIPTLQDCLIGTPLYDWLYGKKSESHQLKNEEATRKELPRNNAKMVFDGAAKFLREQEETNRKNFDEKFRSGNLNEKEINDFLGNKQQSAPQRNGHLTQEEIDALLMGVDDNKEDWTKAEQLEFDFNPPVVEEFAMEIHSHPDPDLDMYLDGVGAMQFDDP